MWALDEVQQTGLANLLQQTLPDQPWWDALRYVAALATAMLILVYARIGFGTERPQGRDEVLTIRIGIVSYLFAILPLCLTEVASIGQPIVPWRLPCVLGLNFFGWWYVRRRL